METHNEKISWLTGLLTGWGIRESWAKMIAGAIVGVAVSLGIFASL